MSRRRITRRDFVRGTATAAAGALVVPQHVLGSARRRAPSDTVNVAIIGAGGMGMENASKLVSQDASGLSSVNIVALCDVDFAYVDRQMESRQKNREGEIRPESVRLKEIFGRAARYADFRVMLERQKDIDAVLIATPDHSHAVIAEAAMRLGKHVYVQKPLAATVHECRVLARTAAETGVVTQMGNQGHSSDSARIINEWIQAGVIGPVREVHIWTNRPIWPQGVPRPLDAAPENGSAAPRTSWNSRAITDATAAAMAGPHTPPDGLDWDLYVGPVPMVPYHPVYHPFNWRGWVDFGVGALGDMGAHLLDHPYWALDLTYPTAIEATSTPFGGTARQPATYPQAMTAHYEFPARGMQPPLRLHWYDGGLMPPRPSLLPDDVPLNREGGVLYIGEWGVLMHETYGRNPKLFPASLQEQADLVPHSYARVPGGEHELNWINAIRGETRAVSPFSYAAPLTEVMLLGIAALRAGQGRRVLYDAHNMRFTNADDANQYLTREYRDGWTI
jgi:predicted dehydrogenase